MMEAEAVPEESSFTTITDARHELLNLLYPLDSQTTAPLQEHPITAYIYEG